MQENVILKMTNNFYPNEENSFFTELFQQYNKVVIESLITSFGLDLFFAKTGIINDRYGGDVDTIHNVRKIGKDKEMNYKNKENKSVYENRGKYNRDNCDEASIFNSIKDNKKNTFGENGYFLDEYTNGYIRFSKDKISSGEKASLDHILSCKSAYDDRGRVLADMTIEESVDFEENYAWTNSSLNSSMGEQKKSEYINSNKPIACKLNEESKKRILEKEKKAEKIYNTKINKVYYTSSKFRKDVFDSSMKVGVQMGVRQVVGFVLSEVIFTVMEEFEKEEKVDDFEKIFLRVSSGIKKGFEKAREKYKDIIVKFKDGALSGILASLTTTLTNIFFTTSKNIVKIIRQVWVSIVEAIKILFLNPDNLLFGERMRAAAKILATGASITIGIITKEFLSKFGIAQIPYVGETLANFIELLTVGITTCTFLYFLDRSEIVNKLVSFLNRIPTMSNISNYYKQQAKYFENYAAELLKIDLKSFEEEIDKFNNFANKLENAQTETELNGILKQFFIKMKLELPWEGNFDNFMGEKTNTLIFK